MTSCSSECGANGESTKSTQKYHIVRCTRAYLVVSGWEAANEKRPSPHTVHLCLGVRGPSSRYCVASRAVYKYGVERVGCGTNE